MTAGALFGFEGFRRDAVDHCVRSCMHRFPTVHCSQRRSPRSPGPADQADRTAGQVAPTILMRSAFELCTCLDRGNVACFWISTGSARSSSLTPRSPPAYEVQSCSRYLLICTCEKYQHHQEERSSKFKHRREERCRQSQATRHNLGRNGQCYSAW